jgi:metal-responsive CopG/Arc/MetJ family transcriptional regulator
MEAWPMSTVKTAISVPRSLFERMEQLAGEMRLSRSRLIALAVQEFISRHENRKLLRALNKAHEELPGPAEQLRLEAIRDHHRRLIEGEW